MILPAESVPLSQYSTHELSVLRKRIEDLLPAEDLAQLDLTAELLRTYRDVQLMLTQESGTAPLNQRAQTVNTLTSILKQLAELQRSHFSASRLQAFEKAFATLAQRHPEIDLLSEYKALVAPTSPTPTNG